MTARRPPTRMLMEVVRLKYLLEEMSSLEVRDALRRGMDTAIVAIGSTEQHGPHLPLTTDSLLARVVAERIAQKLANAVLAPVIRVGCSDHHMDFPGTLSLRAEVLQGIIEDYCSSLKRHGFKRIALLPLHGGNFAPLAAIYDRLREEHADVHIVAFTDLAKLMGMIFEVGRKHGVDPKEAGAHGGEAETSMVLAVRPDLVDMGRAVKGFVGDHEEVAPMVLEQGMRAVSKSGVLGDATKASKARGEAYIEELAERLAGWFKERFSSS